MNQAHPITFVLFGATGDLAQKKIMPALLNLFRHGKIPKNSKILAFSRRTWNDYDYRKFIAPSLQDSGEFLKQVFYFQGSFDLPESYEVLAYKLRELDREIGKESEKILHLSIQPEFYLPVVEGLAQAGIIGKEKSAKILIEKPFGQDLNSALNLEEELELVIKEDEIYRIDHYLGKTGLWNMFETRMQDKNLESSLNNQDVQSISVRFLEKIGIEGRGEFYDSVGVIRDVVQNHVLEMLAVSTMDIQEHMSDEEIIKARAKVLGELKPVDIQNISQHVEKAQYEGYVDEQDVPKNSQTETYVKIKTEIENKRWQGSEIILEAGKAMKEKKSEVEFMFKDSSKKVFTIDEKEKDAYEIILEDAILNRKKNFVSKEEVVASWKFIDPILKNKNSVTLKRHQ